LPGVRQVTRDAFFLADVVEVGPVSRAQLDSSFGVAQVRGSTDGRFLAMDRPALHQGRLPTGRQEALVSMELARAEGIEVGDVLPVTFFPAGYSSASDEDDLVAPLGLERVTVVGIGTLSDEVLPDGVWPRQRMVVSADIAARYDCNPPIAPAEASLEELLAVMTPPDCATSYPYYSLDVAGGAAGLTAALDEFTRTIERLNAELPDNVEELGAAYFPILTTTADERERVEHSVQPTVTALGVLAGGTAAVAIVVVGLAAARQLRRSEDEQWQWWRMGLPARQRAAVAGAPLVAAIGAGVAGSLVVAWLASPVAPVGAVGSVDPRPGRWLSSWVAVGAVAFAVGYLATVVLLAVRSARRVGTAPAAPRPGTALQRLVRLSNRPEVVEGLRAAFARGRGAGVVTASGGLAAGVFMAAVVFGASLATVVATPAAYGWPWDLAVMGGYGYGRQDLGAIEATLDARGDVDGWTGLGFGLLSLDGEPVVSMTGVGGPGGIGLTVAAGRLPVGDEVALGSRTAAERGLELGEVVELSGEGLPPRRATVSGIVVLPAVGPFQADRAAPGRGAVVPAGFFADEIVASQVSFVGIDLVDGTDGPRALTELHADFVGWSRYGDPPVEYPTPVRPPEIVDLAGLRTLPLVVGGLLALAASAGLVFAITVSVRARRRELATLRALGFSARQLRASVLVQAVTTMVVALAIGVPLGVAAGRVLWRSFADRLGVLPYPTVPLRWIAAAIVGGLVVAAAAAALPGRAAARADAATVLRGE
jgi:hypothetical protein